MSNNNNIKLIEITDDIGNCKKGNNDNSILCPICSKNLTGFSENVIQAHVNRCLDGPTLKKNKKSLNKKIQSSITSYMNIATTNQCNETPYMKISKKNDNDSSIGTNTKIFNTQIKSKNQMEKITKFNSFNENFNKSNIDNDNNHLIAKSKSLLIDVLNHDQINKGKEVNNDFNNNNNEENEENIFIEDISLKKFSDNSINKNKINLINDSYLNERNQKSKLFDKDKNKNENSNFNQSDDNEKYEYNIRSKNNNEHKYIHTEIDKKNNLNNNNNNNNNNNSSSSNESDINNRYIEMNFENKNEEILDGISGPNLEKRNSEFHFTGIPFMFEDIEDFDVESEIYVKNINNNYNNKIIINDDSNLNKKLVNHQQKVNSIKLEIQQYNNDNRNSDNNHYKKNDNINNDEISFKSLRSETNDKTENNLNSNLKDSKKRKRKEKDKKEKVVVAKLPRKKKICPSYKKVENTTFVVDAFNYGKIENITAYFLSHFHSDHYGGITSKFDYGPIYCSQVTSNLLIELLKVEEKYVHPLELNKEYVIDGVKVTLIDANHCPGAVLFLFSIPIGENKYFNALHTGDFRANIDQLLNPAIQGLKNSFMDILYLDTTYLEPEHIFPSQEIVINSVIDVLNSIIFEGKTVKEYNNMEKNKKLKSEYHGGLLRYFTSEKESETSKANNVDNIYLPLGNNKKRVLILVGTYLIGKEKVFLGIAKFLKSKIFVSNKKKKILECLNDKNISELLTSNPDESCVHVLNMAQLGIESVNNYYNIFKDKYDMVIAFRPTGWVFKPKKGNKKQLTPDSKKILEDLNNLKLKATYYNRNVSIWGIPYSEHSSFVELENFIRVLSSITPIRYIQPTVNVGSFYGEKGRKYWDWFDSWRNNPLMI